MYLRYGKNSGINGFQTVAEIADKVEIIAYHVDSFEFYFLLLSYWRADSVAAP